MTARTVVVPRARRVGRRLGQVAVLVALILASFVGWLAAGDEAEADELARAIADHEIVVTDEAGVVTITPAAGAAPDAVGVAFLPGTRVQPDAYVATWAPIVEATGVVVHISAVPLNLPLLAGDAIDDVISANPGTTTWIVGGHSMGGFEAAAYAATAEAEAAGLLLWASGPAETDLTESDVPALLVAGAADNVLPPSRIIDQSSLAPDTTVVVIDGMVHGQFGRYSDTEDPLDPTRRSDEDTLTDLVAATTGFLDRVARR